MNIEKTAKIILFISGILLILVGVPRLILNAWIPYSQYVFYVVLVLILIATLMSYKSIIEILSLKSTKHGLNMGTLILLGLVLYIFVNFFAFRYDKSFDITKQKLNSISQQSVDILKNLKEKVSLNVYYQGDVHKNEIIGLKILFKKYQAESNQINYKLINAYKDLSAAQVLKREDKGKIVIIASNGKMSQRVSEPIEEESITSAIYRLNQTSFKTIYFLTGHGERQTQTDTDQQQGLGYGIGLLIESLNAKGIKTEVLNLGTSTKIPEDAALVAIIGPKKDLIDSEFQILKSYLTSGGRLFVAVDPSNGTNYNQLTELMGVRVDKNYLLTTQTVAGADALTVLGQNFPYKEIAKDLEANAITLFYESSSVNVVQGNSYKQDVVVGTNPIVIPVNDIQNYKTEVQGKESDSYNIGIISSYNKESEHNHDDADSVENHENSKLAVFGDSDFLSDVYISTGFNKDLALNTFAYMVDAKDLISIRPKTADETKVILTTLNSIFLIFVPVLSPLILLLTAAILWFRRRSA